MNGDMFEILELPEDKLLETAHDFVSNECVDVGYLGAQTKAGRACAVIRRLLEMLEQHGVKGSPQSVKAWEKQAEQQGLIEIIRDEEVTG